MKKSQHILRPASLITLGLLLALLSAALSQPVTVASQNATGTPTPQATATSTPINPAEIGSTNGLVFVSVLITIIILIPMFLRWKTWLKKP